ncbi:MerR family transcriptional regulator [Gorillibacterium sp. sgz5001074]|uniref:MerR family transcriptional regulator n=1 Tax=Gorillibacterium sp. sgz5001074 TaxID=3446695 RepID=UPI003F679FA4
MFKIGAFAKLSGVTVKTLRHYDEIGLLKPALVDDESGYRYYSAEQLLTIRRIAGFKDQGLTLEMMRPLLNGPLTQTQVKSTLLEKREILKQQIREAQQQLEEVDKRLQWIEWDAKITEEGRLSFREVKPILVASVCESLPNNRLCLVLDELKQYVRTQGEETDREMIIIWHRKADCNEENSDLEVAMPITKPILGSRRVKIHELPGMKKAASYIHQCDPYANQCHAGEMMMAWIADQGYRRLEATPVREIYLTSDQNMYGPSRMAEMIVPVIQV